MSAIQIGRLLRAGTSGFVVGCRVDQMDAPVLGGLVRVAQERGDQVYGIIYDIHIDDDGLVRQLAIADRVDENVIADNRVNRNIPLEVSVLAVGYRQHGQIYHLLPPHPPLSLDVIYLCEPEELCEFTSAGRFGYFRHLLRAKDLPVGEILAAHLKLAHSAQCSSGDPNWSSAATQELITLLRDDYPTLMAVLGAIGDVGF
jgi:hypothetical protein